MLSWLDYRNWGKRSNNIALVSLHIPKCAGTSFRNMLKEIYGSKEVVRVDIHLRNGVLKVDQKVFKKKELPHFAKVIHGHFSPELLVKSLRFKKNVPFITWLRHPVKRVASNYFYLAKRLEEELDEERKGLQLLYEMQRSLLEYAEDEINQNRIAKFLAGKTLSEFAFVGIQEHFEEDVQSLAHLMNWSVPPLLHQNKTGVSYALSEEEYRIIAELNQEDIALYEQALQLRENRINSK